jgi:hypothetical protein
MNISSTSLLVYMCKSFSSIYVRSRIAVFMFLLSFIRCYQSVSPK